MVCRGVVRNLTVCTPCKLQDCREVKRFQRPGAKGTSTLRLSEEKRVTQERWTAVDSYINELLIGKDAVLEQVLAASAAAGLPEIQVSPRQGKLLQLLAQMQKARRILEIGTLG